jgi:hypothetical protein
VKFVTSTVMTFEGKVREPALVLTCGTDFFGACVRNSREHKSSAHVLGARSIASGIVTQNVAPCPGVLSTPTLPPRSVANLLKLPGQARCPRARA